MQLMYCRSALGEREERTKLSLLLPLIRIQVPVWLWKVVGQIRQVRCLAEGKFDARCLWNFWSEEFFGKVLLV